MTRSLVSGRTVEVPNTEVTDVLDLFGDSLETFTISDSSLDEATSVIGRQ